jgi:serine/threonine protein kinase
MPDEWNEWIEDAITKMHIKYFNHEQFRNIEEIGHGGFGDVYRANWKNSEQHLALKSLSKLQKLDVVVAKELVQEVIINV